MEKDIAVNTQGNALFCTILCHWKGWMPFCFESTNFFYVFHKKLSVNWAIFSFFFWWYILMMSLLRKVCSIFLWSKTKSHNRANSAEVVFCLRSCKLIHVMCFRFFRYYEYYFDCSPCSQSACKLGRPPFFSFF